MARRHVLVGMKKLLLTVIATLVVMFLVGLVIQGVFDPDTTEVVILP